MQPYEEANLAVKRQLQKPMQAGISLGASAIGTAAGSSIISKIAPFLNRYIPNKIMKAGLEKINPNMKNFIQNAIDNDYTLDDIRSFLRDKINPNQEEESPQIGGKSSLEGIPTRYPELFSSLQNLIQAGNPPQIAAKGLKGIGKFKKAIQEIEKETGLSFEDMILEMMGPQGQEQTMMQPQMQAEQVSPQEMSNPMSPTGQVDPKLMALLQSLQQGIKSLRGPNG